MKSWLNFFYNIFYFVAGAGLILIALANLFWQWEQLAILFLIFIIGASYILLSINLFKKNNFSGISLILIYITFALAASAFFLGNLFEIFRIYAFLICAILSLYFFIVGFGLAFKNESVKKISTWASIIIVAAVILFGGVFAYQHFFVQQKSKTAKPTLKITTLSVALPEPSSTLPTLGSETATVPGWNTYDNFGFEFQYPNSWGNPQESFARSDYDGDRININFDGNDFGSYGECSPAVSLQVAEFSPSDNNSSPEYKLKESDIKYFSTNGRTGIEFFVTRKAYNAGTDYGEGYYGKGGTFTELFEFAVQNKCISKDIFNEVLSTFKINGNTVFPQDPSNHWGIYKNNTNKIQFEIPDEGPNTNEIEAIESKPGSVKINKDGCYATSESPTLPQYKTYSWDNETNTTINNIKFCVTHLDRVETIVGPASSSDYFYTTFRDGYYYTIHYTITGWCSNPQDDGTCLDKQDYGKFVLKPIQDSISTFQFITTAGSQQPSPSSFNIPASCPLSASELSFGLLHPIPTSIVGADTPASSLESEKIPANTSERLSWTAPYAISCSYTLNGSKQTNLPSNNDKCGLSGTFYTGVLSSGTYIYTITCKNYASLISTSSYKIIAE